MCAQLQPDQPAARERYLPVEVGKLYVREIGAGQPMVVIHGGPDFDHTYFLPDMDRLADAYHLIYYDQRGRGRSAQGVQPADVTLDSEIEDLEALRTQLGLESVAVLGHSWGGQIAMEYALRHPDRVSHLILMNAAIASYDDLLRTRQDRLGRMAAHQAQLDALRSSVAYAQGDLETVEAYYRTVFSTAIKKQPEHLQRLDISLPNYTRDGVLKARAIELRLHAERWNVGFNLIPRLETLTNPTLILHGDYDWTPAESATRVAGAIPGAQYVLLKDCGHFAYLEDPDGVRRALAAFFAGAHAPR